MNNPLLPWQSLASTCSFGIADLDWNLADFVAEGHPDRSYDVHIQFATPFNDQPIVQVALTGFDIDQRTSGRVRLEVSELSADGFTVSITTWRDTRVYGVDFSWFAVGP